MEAAEVAKMVEKVDGGGFRVAKPPRIAPHRSHKFSGLVSDGVYENVFLPDLPYVKGEHGNIYFQEKNDEDILQTLASGDNLVDWVSVLEDDEDSDGSLGDWAKLETMRLSHPMDFAKQLADFVSHVPINYMDQPPSGISNHGLLRPAFVEENSKEELQKDESYLFEFCFPI
ncbi:hypothetical protein L2E82_24978 [Cichorium intybus]|uniref:Uncharacterized protein n=1 Tax=Cichorium intybus TaxID=13427 RepID=A0ACB9E3C1_CICIN|nr:hypothetical protein L2E82_24978 [Cichorium intybus]